MEHDVLPWLDYEWSFTAPVGLFRPLCERLRGTPARLEELLRGGPPGAAERQEADRWSIQEHAGHLCLVERLWDTRFRELLRGETALAPADMSNAATEAARLNEGPLSQVLGRFRSARAETLELLDSLKLEDAARVAHHPRLGVAMRLVDLCTFAAEHDDHHMAMIRALLRSTSQDGR
jgi:uncharacterized damage-inducible protein DinB